MLYFKRKRIKFIVSKFRTQNETIIGALQKQRIIVSIIVNKRSFVYKRIAFVEPDRLDKYEKDFGKKFLVLAIYFMREQKYIGSIHVPNRDNKYCLNFHTSSSILRLCIKS